jgi:hypothetical protein
MMFYLVFALGLCAPRKFGIPIVCTALLAFVLIAPQSNSALVVYLASPILLWFLFGISLAVIWKCREVSEPTWIGKPAQILEPIGDSSYSLYLVHSFVLTLVLRVWTSAIGSPSLYLLPTSLAAAIGVAWVIYVVIERPLLRLLSRRTKMQEPLERGRSPGREASPDHRRWVEQAHLQFHRGHSAGSSSRVRSASMFSVVRSRLIESGGAWYYRRLKLAAPRLRALQMKRPPSRPDGSAAWFEIVLIPKCSQSLATRLAKL